MRGREGGASTHDLFARCPCALIIIIIIMHCCIPTLTTDSNTSTGVM